MSRWASGNLGLSVKRFADGGRGGLGMVALGILGLGLLIGTSMAPALDAGFVWDDMVLKNSKAIGPGTRFIDIWLSPELHWPEIHFWPVTYSSFWIEERLWGLDPLGFHIVNLVLHFAITVLAWRLLVRLEVPGAWFAAALFAVHPVHVEPALWVIARKDLLSTLFYLWSAWLWLGVEFGASRRPYRRMAAALLVFALAILSKTTAVTLPAAMLIIVWWKSATLSRRSIERIALFALAGLIIGGGETYYYHSNGSFDFEFGWLDRVILAAKAILVYLAKLLAPFDLAVIYPFYSVDAARLLNWLAPLCVAGLLAVLWFGRSRVGRGPLAAFLYFLVTLSPVLGFANSSFLLFAYTADRYQYLASLSLLALVSATGITLARRLVRRTPLITVPAALIMLAVLGTMSWRQARIYENDIRFFEHVLALNPDAPTANQNLGRSYFEAGLHEKALTHSLVAMDRLPSNYTPRIIAAYALLNLQRANEALPILEEVQELHPDDPNLETALTKIVASNTTPDAGMAERSAVAYALRLLGRLDEGIIEARAALASHGTQAERREALIVAGRIALDLDLTAEAERLLMSAHAIQPDIRALPYLALIHFNRKDFAVAARFFAQWTELEPDNAVAWANLGVSRFEAGDLAAGRAAFETSLSLDPDTETARDGLAAVRAAIERGDGTARDQ